MTGLNGKELAHSLLTLGKWYVLAATIAGGIGSGISIVAMRFGVVEFWPGGGLAQRTTRVETSIRMLTDSMNEWRRQGQEADRVLREQMQRFDAALQESQQDRRDLRKSLEVVLWFNCFNGPANAPAHVRLVCDRIIGR